MFNNQNHKFKKVQANKQIGMPNKQFQWKCKSNHNQKHKHLQAIRTNPISLPRTHIGIISTFPSSMSRTEARPIKCSTNWPATYSTSSMWGWRVSMSARISPPSISTASWQVIVIRTKAMICISTVNRRWGTCTDSIPWENKDSEVWATCRQ